MIRTINYTPKPDAGKTIFDVCVTFKDGSSKSIRSRNYKYDICKPDTTHKVDVAPGTIYPLIFENERVEGLGLSVTIDFEYLLTIKDADSDEFWVIDCNDVREVQTKTCKMILPEKEED